MDRNVSGVETKAVARDEHYLVNGSKLWITTASGVTSHPGREDLQFHMRWQISLFLVDREETTYDAQRVSTMIARSTGTSALSFSDALVPRQTFSVGKAKGSK